MQKVTEEFNRFRFPECEAKVILNRDDILEVEFSGTKAGFSCCFDENFVDYRYYLKDIAGKDFEIVRIKRPKDALFVVKYRKVMERR